MQLFPSAKAAAVTKERERERKNGRLSAISRKGIYSSLALSLFLFAIADKTVEVEFRRREGGNFFSHTRLQELRLLLLFFLFILNVMLNVNVKRTGGEKEG